METKPILLLGGSGQIGQALRAAALPPGWILAAPTRAECDITDHDKVREVFRSVKPILAINTAAMVAVDACEADPDAAMAANFEGPASLAALCAANDVPLVQLSTDFVFDGTDGEKPYFPSDAMNPLSAYGQSKMMGEEAVRHQLPWHVILRVSAVFSAYGANILTRLIDAIESKNELKFARDQIACPTYAPEIATAVITMADAILSGKTDGFGTFHLCGQGPASRFAFAESVMPLYAPYTTKRPRILSALTAELSQPAPRPAWSVLDCGKIADVYGIRQKPWRDGLSEAMNILMQARQKVA